jgi:hypothetical protein
MSAQRERFVGETFVFDRDNHSLPRAHSGLESSRGDRVQISEPIYGAPGVFENLEINPAAAIRAKFFFGFRKARQGVEKSLNTFAIA